MGVNPPQAPSPQSWSDPFVSRKISIENAPAGFNPGRALSPPLIVPKLFFFQRPIQDGARPVADDEHDTTARALTGVSPNR